MSYTKDIDRFNKRQNKLKKGPSGAGLLLLPLALLVGSGSKKGKKSNASQTKPQYINTLTAEQKKENDKALLKTMFVVSFIMLILHAVTPIFSFIIFPFYALFYLLAVNDNYDFKHEYGKKYGIIALLLAVATWFYFILFSLLMAFSGIHAIYRYYDYRKSEKELARLKEMKKELENKS